MQGRGVGCHVVHARQCFDGGAWYIRGTHVLPTVTRTLPNPGMRIHTTPIPTNGFGSTRHLGHRPHLGHDTLRSRHTLATPSTARLCYTGHTSGIPPRVACARAIAASTSGRVRFRRRADGHSRSWRPSRRPHCAQTWHPTHKLIRPLRVVQRLVSMPLTTCPACIAPRRRGGGRTRPIRPVTPLAFAPWTSPIGMRSSVESRALEVDPLLLRWG